MICIGCNKDKPHKARGMCNACYVTWQKTGSTVRVRQPRGEHCNVEGCTKPVKGRGMCEMHLRRERKTGTVAAPVRDISVMPTLHPTYPQWVDFQRQKGARSIVPEWQDDFWAFVAGVGERPTPRSRLRILDSSKPMGPGNFEWREPTIMRLPGETRAEYQRRYAQDHRAANVDMYRGHALNRHYGITVDQYDEMAKAQGHVCAICGQPETDTRGGEVKMLAVDHAHDETKKVRGLLCKSCNVGLGYFKDDISILEKAIAYLAKHKA